MGVVGLAENKATQPSLAGAWAELCKNIRLRMIYVFSDLNFIQVWQRSTEASLQLCLTLSSPWSEEAMLCTKQFWPQFDLF